MRYVKFLLLLLLSAQLKTSSAQQKHSFTIVPLGVLGGIDESNLSAYMVAPAGSKNFICLDAGTLRHGIDKAIANKTFSAPAEKVLKDYIKAYFISHSHLDHLSGLIINSPEDSNKPIYAFPKCIETFKNRYFTWDSWANFANEGEAPALKKYTYQPLTKGEEIAVPNTELKVTAYPLAHSNLQSTAFLVNNTGNYVLYLGDTGPDDVEKSQNLHKLWQTIAPLIKSRQLKAIMIEVSFPNEQPDKTLFGHLTPKWLTVEMTNLSKLTGTPALRNFNVVITHLKPPYSGIAKIKAQLKANNTLGLNYIYPMQGKVLHF